MKTFALLLTTIALTACAEEKRIAVTSVNTLCTSTERYRATDAQIAAFKTDQPLWEPLVTWLATFNKVRDAECLKPKSD